MGPTPSSSDIAASNTVHPFINHLVINDFLLLRLWVAQCTLHMTRDPENLNFSKHDFDEVELYPGCRIFIRFKLRFWLLQRTQKNKKNDLVNCSIFLIKVSNNIFVIL